MSCHCVARKGQKQQCSCPEEREVPCRKDCTIVKPKNQAFHRPDNSKFDEST